MTSEAENDSAESESETSQAGGGGDRGDRSGTRYPYFSEEDAYKFAQAVQETGGNEAREEDLLKHLNLSKTTKTWIYRLSSAREFGLVEKKGQKADARIALTPLGSRLLMPGDQNEMMASRIAAFLTPPLYQKLFERYKGAPVPQITFLRGLLVREHKILDSVSEAAAEAFVASAKYAGLVNDKNAFAATATATEPSSPPDSKQKADEDKRDEDKKPGEQKVTVPSDFIAHVFQLRKDLKVTIPLPPDITAKDVGRLHKWMLTLPIDDEGGAA